MQQQQFNSKRNPNGADRRGVALLLCLFVVFMVSSLILNVLHTEAIQYAVARNVHDYERALYLANAGVHHACAELEADASWRGTVSDGLYPSDDSYSATAADGTGSNVYIISVGVSGDVTRTLEATVEL